jgi:hypothetical protein
MQYIYVERVCACTLRYTTAMIAFGQCCSSLIRASTYMWEVSTAVGNKSSDGTPPKYAFAGKIVARSSDDLLPTAVQYAAIFESESFCPGLSRDK